MTESSAIIRLVRPEDADEWLRMRCALWPDESIDELVADMQVWLAAHDCAAFVAERPAGGLCGFLEVAVRPCNVNGALGRFGYIEGWYVDPEFRRQQVGAALVRAAEQWSREQGCAEIHSDAVIDNLTSEAAHRALGYAEVVRLIHFRKSLD